MAKLKQKISGCFPGPDSGEIFSRIRGYISTLRKNDLNILEGIRFYVSFACSWAFAELKQMEGNAKEIKLICRDENLHLGFTQTMLKLLPKDDPDFIKIKKATVSKFSRHYCLLKCLDFSSNCCRNLGL